MVGFGENLAGVVVLGKVVGRVEIENRVWGIVCRDDFPKVCVLNDHILEPGTDSVDERERRPHTAAIPTKGGAFPGVALFYHLIVIRRPLHRVVVLPQLDLLFCEKEIRLGVEDVSQALHEFFGLLPHHPV